MKFNRTPKFIYCCDGGSIMVKQRGMYRNICFIFHLSFTWYRRHIKTMSLDACFASPYWLETCTYLNCVFMQLYSCMRPLHVSVSGGLHVDKPVWIVQTCYVSISLISFLQIFQWNHECCRIWRKSQSI